MKNLAIIIAVIVIISGYFVMDFAFCESHHMSAAAELLIG